MLLDRAESDSHTGMSGNVRPNILWLMTDQQPATTIGLYGNGTICTPHLDRLAREGVRFDRMYVAAYPCSPSRASLMTGLHGHRHGVVMNDVLLDEALATLGSICREAGYLTAYFGKWHLGGVMERHGDGDGRCLKRMRDAEQFAFAEASGGGGEDEPCAGFAHWIGGWRHYRDHLRRVGFGREVDENESLGAHVILPSGPDSEHSFSLLPAEHHVEAFIADSAVRFIGQWSRCHSRPFAAVVSFYGPHLPVTPPRPWDEMYAAGQVPEPIGLDEDLSAKPASQHRSRKSFADGWSTAQYVDYVRRYWGFVSYIDEQIGRVLAALEATGELDNTIVVFVSDHGDMMGEHGLIYKLTGAVYEILMRCPLVMRYPPGLTGASVCAQLVSSIDVLPSVLELAGVVGPADLDGRSFVGKLGNPQIAHRQRVFTDIMNKGHMVSDGRWKYGIHWAWDEAEELYDLVADPEERRNLVRERSCSDRVRAMRGHIGQWLEETGHPYAKVLGGRLFSS